MCGYVIACRQTVNVDRGKTPNMFTGIIEAVGRVVRMDARDGDYQIQIHSGRLDLSDVKLGDSIATNGVCLTVIQLPGDGFLADVSAESIRRTSLAGLRVGSDVNLEKALTLQSRLGGHLVSGHVDGVGEILVRKADARAIEFHVSIPTGLDRYIAEKGSICVDGISLTVNALHGDRFVLTIVPHTTHETTIDHWAVGSKVNLEVDVMARYMERLLLGQTSSVYDAEPAKSAINQAFLAENGFWRS